MLRTALPWARITLVTTPSLVSVVAVPDLVDEVIPFPMHQPLRRWLRRAGLEALPRRLRRRRFDLALALSNRDHHEILARAFQPRQLITPGQVRGKRIRPASTPTVVSLPTVDRGIDPTLLPRDRPRVNDRRHMVADHVAVVADVLGFEPRTIPPLEIATPPATVESVHGWIQRHAAEPARPLIWIHPGYHRSGQRGQPSSHRRLWSLDRWTALVQELSQDCTVVLTSGTTAESRQVRAIAAEYPHCLAKERPTIPELASVGRLADLFIGLDSGPMHVAAATGTPILVLFGPSHWEITGPWVRSPSRSRILRLDLPCSPCKGSKITCPLNQCMQALHASEVAHHARDMLSNNTVARAAAASP